MFERVSLRDIDPGDETFRISEELDSARLRQSLVAVGQLHPLILRSAHGAGLTVVAGFRRFHAIRSLGGESVLARICDERSRTSLQLFRLALWENLSHRLLNALEAARALRVLLDACALAPEEIVREYLPALGLAPRLEVLRAYLCLNELPQGARGLVCRGLLSARTAERLAAMEVDNRESLALVLGQVRLSASRQRQFLDLVLEAARLRGASLSELLAEPEIGAALSAPAGSPFQKGEALFEIVFRWRHPRLTLARREFEARKRALALPSNVRLSTDPYFEEPAVRVEFEATSLAGFRSSTEALVRAAQAEALAALFEEKP
jgi:ParB-like chromosome segregation protein Spo0J